MSKKRVMSLLIAAAILLALLPAPGAWAADGTVTVRVEGNGIGVRGEDTAVGTVLACAEVPLTALGDAPRAIDAVTQALLADGQDVPVGSDSFYTAFGGVSAPEGASWVFMHNDDLAASGLDSQEIGAGDRIVLSLSSYDESWRYTTDYTYFTVMGAQTDLQWEYPYAEVTLALYQKRHLGWGADGPQWEVTRPAAPLYSNGAPAGTPGGSPAATDSESGMATITLWGGQTAGTYTFDITAETPGAAHPFCRAAMVYDGLNPPSLSFSQPSARDTSLTALTLRFGETATDGLPYLGTDGMTVGHAVSSVAFTASAAEGGLVEAAYQAAGAADAAPYTLGTEAALEVGENRLSLTVTNGTDARSYTLTVTRRAGGARDLAAEVAAVLAGVRSVTGDPPCNDWLLAMGAAGLSPAEPQLRTHLAAVLTTVDAFADTGTGNVGTLAKTALGLAAVGIDARQIPDPDSGAPIDLLEEIGTWTGVVHPLYAAPYVLSLYDLGPYDAPRDAVLTREGLLASILEAQDAVTGLWETADGTGMVLAALAPYYQASDGVYGVSAERCAEITAAVDDALAALSAMQTMDGGFGGRNASTTATVLTALNALGIDAQTDPRFDKGGATPLTNLLSFRTAGDQLGYTDAETPNALASYQGFQALATYQNLTAGTRSRSLYQFPAQVDVYLSWPDAKLLTAIAITAGPTVTDYTYDASQTAFAVNTDGLAVTAVYNGDPSNTAPVDLSDCTISPINRASPGTRQVTVSYQGKTDIFFVTVLEEDNSVPAQDRASVKVRGLRGVIAEGSAVIEAGVTTALDALKSVLTAAGTPAVIQGGAYVVSIDGLGEFDEGENSGWMYAVNGVTPSDTAANQYRLYAGDQVVWYYVTDYTSDGGGADGPKEEEPPEEPVSFADVSERDWFCQAVFFVADRGLFRGVSETAFAPHDSMDRGMMVTVLWRLAGAPQAGTAAAPLFPDVSEDSYYSEAVEWAVSEHILAGYQTGLFGGGDRVTREQIAVFLFRYAGQRGYDTGASAELTGYGDAGEVSAFAREAVGWANALGLMTGRALDRLAPKAEATRAEVAEVLRRFVTHYAVP